MILLFEGLFKSKAKKNKKKNVLKKPRDCSETRFVILQISFLLLLFLKDLLLKR